jgi:DNA-binding transcriptional MerR regulator/quercetin dioxygenase-like cupin family protein
MAYTVKQVAALSGVSVRTLHFYDETGLLKPAHRELGFELRQIHGILGRADFEKIAALESHRNVLEEALARTSMLIETIGKTIDHLKGTKTMMSNEMFAGFRVAAGNDRFGEHITLGGAPNDCKVSARDTNGALCVFEFNGGGSGPRHLHYDQDEWIYVLDGEIELLLGEDRLRLATGESVFIPRKVSHVWGCTDGTRTRIINVYHPAGRMEEFFRAVGQAAVSDLPTREQVLANRYTDEQRTFLHQLFAAHGMDLLGPPHIAERA